MARKDVGERVSPPSTAPYLWGLRVAVLLHAALLGLQFVTAGQLVAGNPGVLPLHTTGALMTNASGFIQIAAAALLWRPGHGPPMPTVVSGTTILLSLLQTHLGSQDMLALHVPTAMAIVVLVMWTLTWSWTRPVRGTAG
ncbi:hypothetical protein [Allosalinactinospora lopnorensis]|uniref:hypothetical protein n=1 Tax=Allosalinactinospora lopnorensis TaxID=1352348 RepID=UPI000623C80E|nr:hypothetical protein [Allosalinactinospora lopnorensis]